MNKFDPTYHDSNDMLFTILHDLNRLSARINHILNEDLAQTSYIVSDVINHLIKSFNLINSDLDSLSESGMGSSDRKNLEATISSIKSSINIIQRCMQFEDIVQQLVVHSSHIIEQNEKLLVNMAEELQKIDIDHDRTNLEESLMNIIQAIKTSTELIEKESPVKQNSLKKGNIEIF